MRATVDLSREILSADSTFAAVGDGDTYPITIMSGIRDRRFGEIKSGAAQGSAARFCCAGKR